MVRALVLSNMLPDAAHPERGRFVRDQVDALRHLDGLQVELYEFRPGGNALRHAFVDLRSRYAGKRFDVVHAHFGLSAWPAFAVRARVRALTVHGTDVRHPRTRQATRAVLPLMDLLAAVSASLAREIPGRAARRRTQVLPCGVDLDRFGPLSRKIPAVPASAMTARWPSRATSSCSPSRASILTGLRCGSMLPTQCSCLPKVRVLA